MELEIAERRSEAKSYYVTSSHSSSNTSSESEDDEWKPSGRRRPKRLVNAQRSQATRLMWKRKRAARRQASEAKCPPASSPASTGALAHRRFPLCWSDTTLGSSMAGKRRKVAKGSSLGKRRICERPLALLDVGEDFGLRLRSGPHRACRPKLFQRDDSQSDEEDAVLGTSFKSKEGISKAGSGSEWDGYSGAGRLPQRRKPRPRLLQKKHVEEEILGPTDEPPLFAENTETSTSGPPWPRLPPRPRMLSRGNYVTEEVAPRSESPALDPTRCSRKKSPPLAAKQRWERCRTGNEPEFATFPDLPPPEDTNGSKDSQSDFWCNATFTLPAKLRWKWNSLDTSRGLLAAEVPTKENEETKDKVEDCSLPAKLRWKQDRSLPSRGQNEGSVGRLPPTGTLATSAEARPDSSVSGREDKVNRRSHAKKLWWQRMKSFALDGSRGALAEPIPKFLQAELFPNMRTKRRPRRSQREGTGAEPQRPSRRSLAMKENWRKRKEAWIQAAAKSVAALAPAAPNLAEQLVEVRLAEWGSGPQLARSMFLAQCRSAQQAALLSEMALVEGSFHCGLSAHL